MHIENIVPYDVSKELKKLKVRQVLYFGRFGYEKGRQGYVFKVKIGMKKIAALKVAAPSRTRKEVTNLKFANKVGVGPKLLNHTKHIAAMEFIDGPHYPEWLENADYISVRNAVLSLLDQCYELDKIGLDHGQLSTADKHIIIAEKPCIVDFEKGGKRKARNVSSLLNYLILNPNNPIAAKTRKKLNIDTAQIRRYATDYTRARTEEAFSRLKEGF
jgi:putative serine/threonine protein kinase